MLITVEGNISSGKTTLIRHIKQKIPSLIYFEEPVELWENINGFNALKAFYQKEISAFSFQTLVLHTLEDIWRKAIDLSSKEKVILERTPFTSQEIFTKQLLETDNINRKEVNILQFIIDKLPIPEIDLCIYVNKPPEICFHNKNKRARDSEKMVPYSYLMNLHSKHEDWYNTSFNPLKIKEIFVYDICCTPDQIIKKIV